MNKFLVAAAVCSASIATPAIAQSAPVSTVDAIAQLAQEDRQARAFRLEQTRKAAMRWEVAYQAMSAVDAGVTIYALETGRGEESNPIWGKKPSPAVVIGAKAVGGAAHYFLVREIAKTNPKLALRIAQVSFVVQTGVVAWNVRVAF